MWDINSMEEQCVELNDRIYTQQKKMERLQLTEEALRTSETKVAFYTGTANFAVLLGLFSMIEKYVAHGANNSMTKFLEFVLFSMKVKLNLQSPGLTFRFGVSEATVSRIFHKWLNVAYCRLKSQIAAGRCAAANDATDIL
ncbi:hypothetical protein HPB48_021222 [Haemaphysalis longicornis]|uniref:Transposase Helix-turn-helix domain-containing protein n=1 Tax=Haemaphysalis longicornis TaxID=44386 RepID=A0A9J6H3J0_HAELO|nr:hypothetical protein HPB48_021222 [Haemaphysalis longicornis]